MKRVFMAVAMFLAILLFITALSGAFLAGVADENALVMINAALAAVASWYLAGMVLQAWKWYRGWRNRPCLPGKDEWVAVVTHRRPDFDAWGASVGLALALQRRGCHVEVVADLTSTPTVGVQALLNKAGIPVYDCREYGMDTISRKSRLFVVDCSGLDRCCIDLTQDDLAKVTWIDHHGTPEWLELAREWVLGESVGSASALVYGYLTAAVRYGDLDIIPAQAAQALLLGHLGDTLGLTKASPGDLQDAAAMADDAGKAGTAEAWSWFRTRTRAEAAFRAAAFAKAASQHGQVVAIGFDQADFAAAGCGKSAMAGLAGELLELEGVRAVVTATPDVLDGEFALWRISVRTAPNFPVRAVEIARQFGGNGHPDAAGCAVEHNDTTPDAASAALKVAKALTDELNHKLA